MEPPPPDHSRSPVEVFSRERHIPGAGLVLEFSVTLSPRSDAI